MSISSTTYGAPLFFYGGTDKQGFFKTSSDTSLSYSYSNLSNLGNSFCAGLGQDPDEHSAGAGYWTDYSTFPFPVQCTTNTNEGDDGDNILSHSIKVELQSITCLSGTIIPTFDDGSTERWMDMAISAISVDDYVYTATTSEANINTGSVRLVVDTASHGSQNQVQYYTPQFDSVDYYGLVGKDDTLWCVFIAWDSGNAHI